VSTAATAALVWVAVAGCIQDRRGSEVTQHLLDAASSREIETVVVTSPASCGSCSLVMVEWIDAIRREPETMRLHFTRRPSEHESAAWTLARIVPQGVIAGFEELPVDVLVVARLRSGELMQIDTVRTPNQSSSVLQELGNEGR
jgi:hypothetical protein